MVISNMHVILQHSIYHRTMAASSPVAIVGATPYTLFLKVFWVNMQLASFNRHWWR
jgi:hypothetical protein